MKRFEQTEEFMVWLRKLRDRTARSIILDQIARLARGLPGDVAPGRHGDRPALHYGPGDRVYFTECQQTLIIVLCGGNKAASNAISAKPGNWPPGCKSKIKGRS